jgi:hypothetical protein
MDYLKNRKTFPIKIFDVIFVKSWWVILFLLICFIGYYIGVKKRNKAIAEMECKYDKLLVEKQIVFNKKEDLQSRLQSQSDPAWIEMVLMKELGVVPENKIKVHFKK